MNESELDQRAIALWEFAQTQCHYERLMNRRYGLNFNLFNILGVGHYEVRTHSPFIAELLNPSGSHGQRGIFLKGFVECLLKKSPHVSEFDADKVEVLTECGIGSRTEEGGGRVDILIRDHEGPRVIIENKIYAGEQENQIARYAHDYPNAALVYLTLFGDEPSSVGKTGRPEKLVCISYRDDILGWLDDCRKEAAELPTVRESIVQYTNLIKQLTNQNTDSNMSFEIAKKVTADKEALEAYFAICGAETEIRKIVIEKMNDGLERLAYECCNSHGMSYVRPRYLDMTKEEGFSFSSDELSARDISIGFQFDSNGYRDFAFGICHVGSRPTSLLKKSPSSLTMLPVSQNSAV